MESLQQVVQGAQHALQCHAQPVEVPGAEGLHARRVPGGVVHRAALQRHRLDTESVQESMVAVWYLKVSHMVTYVTSSCGGVTWVGEESQ